MYNSFYFDEPTQRSCVSIWIWTIFDFAIVSKLPHSNYHYLHVIIPHRLFHIDYSQGFKQGLYYHFKGLLEISELYYDTHYDYYYSLFILMLLWLKKLINKLHFRCTVNWSIFKDACFLSKNQEVLLQDIMSKKWQGRQVIKRTNNLNSWEIKQVAVSLNISS